MENILPWGRQRRLIAGGITAAVAVGLAVMFVMLTAGAWWFLLLFLLVWLAAMMLLQARDRT